ncbi:MAG TPA: tyrosine-protein phosphatase [Candidatus Binataceae bacterium]
MAAKRLGKSRLKGAAKDDTANAIVDDRHNRTRLVVDFELLKKMGGSNFRDLGGHPVRGGGSVRREQVYRSAHLARVPEGSPLTAIRFKTVVTLQSRVEVSVMGEPHETVRESARWEHIPIGDQWFQTNGAFTPIERQPGTEHLVLVSEFKAAWRTFFNILAEGERYPLLFHCSAGRDRTGVGAAMLLELLGVARERIVADFLESNLVFPKAPLAATQLDPVFEAIDDAGGVERFMQHEIGITSEALGTIRRGLIEN